MGLEPLPYYKWLVRDYRANRKVQRMSYLARGLYRELLDEAWLEGSLPVTIDALAEICGCPEKVMEKAWPEIEPCFFEHEGRLYNRKLEDQRTDTDRNRVRLANAGRSGALAKQKLAEAKHEPSISHIEEKSREEKSREENTARSVPPEELAGTLPLVGGFEYQISKSQIAEWQKAYPGIDVRNQLMQAKSWLRANPRKQKTGKGIERFLISWLSRAQDKPQWGANGQRNGNILSELLEDDRKNAGSDGAHAGSKTGSAYFDDLLEAVTEGT